jgi:hypothetical protein
MVEAVQVSKERVQRLEAAIEEFVPTWSLAPVVRALQAGLAGRHVESVMDASSMPSQSGKSFGKAFRRQPMAFRKHLDCRSW